MSSPVRRIGRSLRTPLYRNTIFLMAAAGISYGLGFLFWLVVARFYPDAQVGEAVTLMNTILFLGTVASLGLGFGLVRFLPADPGKHGLVNYALSLTIVAALGIGFVFLVGVDLWASGLAFVTREAWLVVVFFVSIVGFSVAALIDHMFLAVRRADFGMIRMAVYNLLRLPFPIAFAASLGTMGIALAWTIPLLISVTFAATILTSRSVPGHRWSITARLSAPNGILRYSLWNQAANIAVSASTTLLPLIIVNTVSGDAGVRGAAYFYAAYAFASLLYLVPVSFSSSLFVEGSHSAEEYSAETRRTLRASLALVALGVGASVVIGPPVFGLFGPQYVTESYPSFLVLALASPVVVANYVMMTHLRVSRRVAPLVAITTVSAFAVLSSSVILIARFGILGAALGFLLGQLVALGLFAFDALARLRPTLRPIPGGGNSGAP